MIFHRPKDASAEAVYRQSDEGLGSEDEHQVEVGYVRQTLLSVSQFYFSY